MDDDYLLNLLISLTAPSPLRKGTETRGQDECRANIFTQDISHHMTTEKS